MKKILLVLCLLLYCGTAMATEWTTPEALRAFGKPGDTVNPNARKVNNDQIHNKRISQCKEKSY